MSYDEWGEWRPDPSRNAPGATRTASPTSVNSDEAAALIEGVSGAHRMEVLNLIRESTPRGGMTDEDLALALPHQKKPGVRRQELAAEGSAVTRGFTVPLIKRAGRKKTTSGRWADLWIEA